MFRRQEYAEAIDAYTVHLKKRPNDIEAYWRLARAAICAGDIQSNEMQQKYYHYALQASTNAVQFDSLHSNAQCWYAISLGYIALTEGNRKKVELCHRIQNALAVSIAVDPENDVAYSVLGSFYRALGNINWVERQLAYVLLGGLPNGGYADAERMLLKAIELAPTILRHRYELGMLYFDWGKQEQGREVFRTSLQLPLTLASDRQRIITMKQKLSMIEEQNDP